MSIFPLDSFAIYLSVSLIYFQLLSKFKVTIVKFNAAYPYGHKQEVYTKFAESTYTVNDLLVAEVAVKDYGDKENEELIKRFVFSFILMVINCCFKATFL